MDEHLLFIRRCVNNIDADSAYLLTQKEKAGVTIKVLRFYGYAVLRIYGYMVVRKLQSALTNIRKTV